MSEDEEVTASDVIDRVIEYLGDIKALDAANEDGGYRAVSWATEEKNRSYYRLQTKLDSYVDQRIKKMLVESNLIKVVDPLD